MRVKERAAQIAEIRAANNYYGYTNNYPNNQWWREPLSDTDCGSFQSKNYHDALAEAGIETGHVYYEPTGGYYPWDGYGFLEKYFDRYDYDDVRNEVGDILVSNGHTVMITRVNPDYVTHARCDDDGKPGDWTYGSEVRTERLYTQNWNWIFRLKDRYNLEIEDEKPIPEGEDFDLNTLPTVEMGTTGYEGVIMTIQYVLKYKLGYEYQKTNGIFDEQLDYNIRHFQREHDLVDDGIVGPLTYEALFTAGYEAP